MAKAKEYAEEIKRNGCTTDAQSAAALKFIDEISGTIKERKCYSDAAYLAVFKEYKQKWDAVCRLVPEVMPEAFSVAVYVSFPTLYGILVNRKAIVPVPEHVK